MGPYGALAGSLWGTMVLSRPSALAGGPGEEAFMLLLVIKSDEVDYEEKEFVNEHTKYICQHVLQFYQQREVAEGRPPL